jgi:hypothetical protein
VIGIKRQHGQLASQMTGADNAIEVPAPRALNCFAARVEPEDDCRGRAAMGRYPLETQVQINSRCHRLHFGKSLKFTEEVLLMLRKVAHHQSVAQKVLGKAVSQNKVE